MAERDSFTLTDVAEWLGVAQHRLIHLCEKGVVEPDLQDARGRGSSRVFSLHNLLEFAVALQLRDMMLPVAAVRAILHVLDAFERRLKRELPTFSLPDSIRDGRAADFRIILSDGRLIFFSLGRADQKAKLYGGIPLELVMGGRPKWDGRIKTAKGQMAARSRQGNGAGAGKLGPEGSHFARLELSVTEVARNLPLD